jgi:hypothetical protein
VQVGRFEKDGLQTLAENLARIEGHDHYGDIVL